MVQAGFGILNNVSTFGNRDLLMQKAITYLAA
jgi:hypothetical protein